MVAVGMLFTWLGYSLGLQGWCLWRDYDVTLGQLMSPFHPYSGPWPPAPIPAGQTWPGGVTSTTGSSTGTGTGAAAPQSQAEKNISGLERIQQILRNLPGIGGLT